MNKITWKLWQVIALSFIVGILYTMTALWIFECWMGGYDLAGCLVLLK